MARLIDGDALYEKTAEWEAQALHMVEKTMNDEDTTEWRRWSAILAERSAFKFDVADAATVDAVPVVRCKDCKHTKTDGMANPAIYCKKWDRWEMPSDFYCKYGKRKGGDE